MKFQNVSIHKTLLDIRFWIFLLFIIRLIGITNAPLEIGHNWRQCLTNMITRNFFENGASVMYPTIDMAGDQSGIIGSEFPIFNYLIYLVASVFDYTHWLGRLINLLVSSFGLYYFYRLIRDLVNREAAYYAAIVLGTSIWFAFSRKVMPDTFSVSLVIIGLYYCNSYIRSGAKLSIALFFIFSTLGLLSKIPALSIMSIIGVTLFMKEIPLRRKLAVYVSSFVCLLFVGAWYFYWVPHLVETYKYQLFFTKGIWEGLMEIMPMSGLVAERFYFSALHSFIGFACFIGGLYYLFKNHDRHLLTALSLITFTFLIFVLKTRAVFPLHNYYIIPFVPLMASITGYFLYKIPTRKYAYLILGIIAIESIGNQQHDFFIKDSERYKLNLESIADNTIGRDELIVINGGQSPQQIYFIHRKGWTFSDTELQAEGLLDSLIARGAKYLIINKTTDRQPDFSFPEKYADRHYSVFALGALPENKEN